jgi:hypothetical protein
MVIAGGYFCLYLVRGNFQNTGDFVYQIGDGTAGNFGGDNAHREGINVERQSLRVIAVKNLPALRRQYFRAAGNVMGMGTVLFTGEYLHIEQAQTVHGKYHDKKNPKEGDADVRALLMGIVVI